MWHTLEQAHQQPMQIDAIKVEGRHDRWDLVAAGGPQASATIVEVDIGDSHEQVLDQAQVCDRVELVSRQGGRVCASVRSYNLSHGRWRCASRSRVGQHTHEVHDVGKAAADVRHQGLVELGGWLVRRQARYGQQELRQLVVVEQQQARLPLAARCQLDGPSAELFAERLETLEQRCGREVGVARVEALERALEERMACGLERQASVVRHAGVLEALDKVAELLLLRGLNVLVVDKDRDGAQEVEHVGRRQRVCHLVRRHALERVAQLVEAQGQLRTELVAREATLKVARAKQPIDERQNGVERHAGAGEPHAKVLHVELDAREVELLALQLVVTQVSDHQMHLATELGQRRRAEALLAHHVDQRRKEASNVDRVVEQIESERVALQLAGEQVGGRIKVVLLGEERDELLAVGRHAKVHELVGLDALQVAPNLVQQLACLAQPNVATALEALHVRRHGRVVHLVGLEARGQHAQVVAVRQQRQRIHHHSHVRLWLEWCCIRRMLLLLLVVVEELGYERQLAVDHLPVQADEKLTQLFELAERELRIQELLQVLGALLDDRVHVIERVLALVAHRVLDGRMKESTVARQEETEHSHRVGFEIQRLGEAAHRLV